MTTSVHLPLDHAVFLLSNLEANLPLKESRFPAPACGGRRLRSTACNMRTTPLVPLASLDLPNRGRRVAFGSYEALLPLLGFSRVRDHVFANPDGINLDFRQAKAPDHGYHRYAPGLNHIGFAAPDRATIERIGGAMAAAGFEVPEIQEFPDGSALFLKDADGMRVEVRSYR